MSTGNITQDLHTVGLNPFAVTLLAESLLKSPLAPLTVHRPQGFFFPVSRSDCADWAGVRFTLAAVPVDESLTSAELLEREARRLVEQAFVAGLVLTVEQVSLQPLAMGNYRTQVSVRPARERS